jgi:AcrR family transcriptional regulator
MIPRKRQLISLRKEPCQARSTRMVADILAAATRVLAREGVARFTTARVAEVAGVSVGSLYQYFPNKEALLFQLQQDEWNETLRRLEEILAERNRSGRAWFRRAVAYFFRTEAEEACLRHALDDAGALFRETREARAHEKKVQARLQAFFDKLLPKTLKGDRAFTAEFMMIVVGAIAEKATGRLAKPDDLDRWTEATVDLVFAYLDELDLAVTPSSVRRKRSATVRPRKPTRK